MRKLLESRVPAYTSSFSPKNSLHVRQESPISAAEAYQGVLPMPELIETDVAYSVLLGAKLADVSVSYGMRYIACREIVHKFCRRANPIAYEVLCIEAAHQDGSSPKLNILQEYRSQFIGAGILARHRKRISKRALLRELEESKQIMDTHQKMFRYERIRQAHLLTELGLK